MGRWADENFDVENSFTEEIIAQVPQSSNKDVDMAVQAAKGK